MKLAGLLTLKQTTLGCLCGVALAAAGCANGVGVPTSPGAVAGASSPAATASQLPFHGSLEGIDTDTVAFPFLSVHLVGTGNATHLGKYTAIFDFRVDLRSPTSPAVGSFTLTAANGDSVFGDLSGRASIANGVATVVETATITGGTGRFAETTGNFTVARTAVQATGATSGSFEGTIAMHH